MTIAVVGSIAGRLFGRADRLLGLGFLEGYRFLRQLPKREIDVTSGIRSTIVIFATFTDSAHACIV